MDQRKAIVLGGTIPHIELINQLKERGYYVILVDYYQNPPAKQKADLHIQESTLDKEKVLELALAHDTDLVISTCIDQANVTACYVGEKLSLPIPYDYKTALNVTDKARMKSILLQNGINTSRYVVVNREIDVNELDLKYPLIVKPTDSVSSKGITKVDRPEELNKCILEAITISRNKSAIIEEFIVGVEIGIDTFIQDTKAKILTTKERRKIESIKTEAQQIFGCFWPNDLSTYNSNKYELVASKIAKAFNLNNTPLMIQAIERNDEIFVLEFGARIGGGESFRLIEAVSGINYVGKAIDSFLGIKVEINPSRPTEYHAENFIYTKGGTFKNISYDQGLIEQGIIEYLDTYKLEGTKVDHAMTSNNRVGVFTVRARTKKELLQKINIAINRIQVYDTEGKPMMRKDIYTNLNSN